MVEGEPAGCRPGAIWTSSANCGKATLNAGFTAASCRCPRVVSESGWEAWKGEARMTIGKRIYWVLALVAFMALAGSAVAVTSRLTSAGGSDSAPGLQVCDQEDQDDLDEAVREKADNDAIEEECGS